MAVKWIGNKRVETPDGATDKPKNKPKLHAVVEEVKEHTQDQDDSSVTTQEKE